MRTVQEKFEDLLASRVDAAGYELVVGRDHANTGHYYVQDQTLATVVEVTFAFESYVGGGVHSFSGPDLASSARAIRSSVDLMKVSTEDLDVVFEAIIELVKKADPLEVGV